MFMITVVGVVLLIVLTYMFFFWVRDSDHVLRFLRIEKPVSWLAAARARALLAALLLYSSVSAAAIDTLICDDGTARGKVSHYGKHRSFLYRDYRVECWHGPWVTFVQVVAVHVVVFFVAGLPIFVFLAMWDRSPACLGDKRQRQKMFLFLSEAFRDGYAFWEAIEVAKLGVLTFIFRNGVIGRVTQFVGATVVTLLSLLAYVAVQPMREPGNNIHAIVLASLLFLLCFLSIVACSVSSDSAIQDVSFGGSFNAAKTVSILIATVVVLWGLLFLYDVLALLVPVVRHISLRTMKGYKSTPSPVSLQSHQSQPALELAYRREPGEREVCAECNDS
jgi:hypothetical protein